MLGLVQRWGAVFSPWTLDLAGRRVSIALAVENVPTDQRSTTLVLHQSIYAIGLFAGPWLSGILVDSFGIQLMFVATALACLILGVIGVRWLFNVKMDNRVKNE